MTRTIDYFFGIGSPWVFIGFDPFIALAQRFDAEIRPHLIPLIEENGGIYSRNRPEARRTYWTKDLRRWAALRGKTLSLENRAALSDPGPAGLLVAAAALDGQDWIGLTRTLQEAFWGRGEDIGRPEVRAALAFSAGFDPEALEARAGSSEVKAQLDANYELARKAGVFGIPTFRYEGELYWGQDSLPFLERHLADEKLIA
ncbi:DsbA family protein [Rhizobiaceae bacterium BDR2-2]|uniref:2-hydroxychromene-2-carboxylate isomerase n=1 Tax=Ectorhizobium quercum TaxID=2965071 RepID=A0AAE3MZX4_9HYPH|nr:DsbA family protein [Ectorhizobium quercum]MCX8998188.1 DsbA family protein [Ectorhizobium quercum]